MLDAYTAAMNGVDNIVFTAGIGENCALVRTKVLQLSWISWNYNR